MRIGTASFGFPGSIQVLEFLIKKPIVSKRVSGDFHPWMIQKDATKSSIKIKTI